MRRKFPFFWILQTLVFTVAGLMSLFCPQIMLELQRGEYAPARVDNPGPVLFDWVLALNEIDPAPDSVRAFLRERPSVLNAAGETPWRSGSLSSAETTDSSTTDSSTTDGSPPACRVVRFRA